MVGRAGTLVAHTRAGRNPSTVVSPFIPPNPVISDGRTVKVIHSRGDTSSPSPIPGSMVGINDSKFIFKKTLEILASLRVTKSGELVCSRGNDVSQTQQYWRRNSNTSSGNRSQHNSSSRHSQSADSGRQSQVGSGGLRTGRSGLPEVISPPPLDTGSDSGAEDGSPPLYRCVVLILEPTLTQSFRTNSYDKDKRRPILRSKSDTAYRYCQT